MNGNCYICKHMDSQRHHSRSYGGGAMPFISHFCAELGRVLTSNENGAPLPPLDCPDPAKASK